MINRPQRVSMVKAPFHNRTFAKDAMEDRQLLFAVSVTARKATFLKRPCFHNLLSQ